MKTIICWSCSIDRFAKKCEIENFLAKKILPTSKCFLFIPFYNIEVTSILFVFYLDTYATTVKIINSLIKQRIKYIATISKEAQN